MQPRRSSRREFLGWTAGGLTAAAMASLGQREAFASLPSGSLPAPHFAPRARRAVHICLCGGLSHLDSFDYKPELQRYHGKPLPSKEHPETFFNQIGLLKKNDYAFHRRGASGLWVSELFPHLATVADELCVIKSMVAQSANHTPATFQENTGFQLNGFPVMGSWISFGLGTETEDLPSFVVFPDSRGYPAGGTINWSNGFLSSRHQGIAFEAKGSPIPDLFPAKDIPKAEESEGRTLLAALNRSHLSRRGSDDALVARMKSYELAARMQLTVPDVADLSQEKEATRAAYGVGGGETNDFGRNCLMTRRLLERGVRFVQLFSGGSFGSPRINWDGHEDVVRNHNREAKRVDQPVAALLKDLRERGMLDDTLVIFTSEFGRTPFAQSRKGTIGKGRDHNMYGFSGWLAGGGTRGGFAYGTTDDIGWKAAE
ncbi:MAG: DUF1501 domain-containing protein, partial [Planctomycetota bacterium]